MVGDAPTVVDDTFREVLVVLRQNACESEVGCPLTSVGPVDVVPQEIRFEPVDEFEQLSCPVLSVVLVIAAERKEVSIGVDRGKVGDMPIERA